MDEVAPLPVAAVSLLREGVAAFGLVGLVMLHVDLEFLRTVRKLALPPVGTVPLLHEILA